MLHKPSKNLCWDTFNLDAGVINQKFVICHIDNTYKKNICKENY